MAQVNMETVHAAYAVYCREVSEARKKFEKALWQEADTGGFTRFAVPTLADGLDPRNKNGVNLTARGAEILYRLFDAGAGYNRAAKTLQIAQNAAKNRKVMWEKLGGANRPKLKLDIDE